MSHQSPISEIREKNNTPETYLRNLYEFVRQHSLPKCILKIGGLACHHLSPQLWNFEEKITPPKCMQFVWICTIKFFFPNAFWKSGSWRDVTSAPLFWNLGMKILPPNCTQFVWICTPTFRICVITLNTQ